MWASCHAQALFGDKQDNSGAWESGLWNFLTYKLHCSVQALLQAVAQRVAHSHEATKPPKVTFFQSFSASSTSQCCEVKRRGGSMYTTLSFVAKRVVWKILNNNIYGFMLTFSLPNSQAKSKGVFLALLIRHGLDWCWSSISDCRKRDRNVRAKKSKWDTHTNWKITLQFNQASHVPVIYQEPKKVLLQQKSPSQQWMLEIHCKHL